MSATQARALAHYSSMAAQAALLQPARRGSPTPVELEGHLKGQTKVTQRAPAGYQNDDQADQDERRYAEA